MYFLECGTPKLRVPTKDIRLPLTTAGRYYSKNRVNLIGKTFFDAGSRKSIDGFDFAAGEFVVKSINAQQNNFLCERVPIDKGDEKELVEFFIGYVEKRVRAYNEE